MGVKCWFETNLMDGQIWSVLKEFQGCDCKPIAPRKSYFYFFFRFQGSRMLDWLVLVLVLQWIYPTISSYVPLVSFLFFLEAARGYRLLLLNSNETWPPKSQRTERGFFLNFLLEKSVAISSSFVSLFIAAFDYIRKLCCGDGRRARTPNPQHFSRPVP